MIKTKTETLYSISDELPGYSHLPYGTDGYNKLHGYHSLDDLESLIHNELAGLDHALNKYDSVYQIEHKLMCDDMKEIKSYLESCLNSIQKLQKYKAG